MVFLFVGRLESHKGVDCLIEAFRKLNVERSRARLVLVGDGALREMVLTIAEANSSISYLGRLSGDDLWATYVSCDVLVLPSSFEPWGLVVNEAMAFGLPVIVTEEVGCVDDLVMDGHEGLVIPVQKHKGAVCGNETASGQRVSRSVCQCCCQENCGLDTGKRG